MSKTRTPNKTTNTTTMKLLVLCFLLATSTIFCQAQCSSNLLYSVDTEINEAYLVLNPPAPSSALYTWDFGDGSPIVSDTGYFNIRHQYGQPGTYSVCVIIELLDGTCTDTICATVVADTSIACIDNNLINTVPCISDNWCPVCGCDGITYRDFCRAHNAGIKQYTRGACPNDSLLWFLTPSICAGHVQVSAAPVFPFTCLDLMWDFGDGYIDTSNNVTATHDYAVDGSYQICLTATEPETGDSQTLCQWVTVNGTNNCDASFTYNFSNDTLYLINTSTGNFTQTLWNYNLNGTAQSSFANDPYGVITIGGTHEVCLTIQDINCNCWDMLCLPINYDSLFSVSMEEIPTNNKVIVFPNPAQDYLVVNTSIHNSVNELLLQNSIGQVVIHTKAIKEKTRINIAHLPEGVYLLILRSPIDVNMRKIIIRH